MLVGMLVVLAACVSTPMEGEEGDGTQAAIDAAYGHRGEIVTGDLASRARDELALLSQPAGVVTLERTADRAALDRNSDRQSDSDSTLRSIAGAGAGADPGAEVTAGAEASAAPIEPDVPLTIPDDAAGAVIVARTWPDRQRAESTPDSDAASASEVLAAKEPIAGAPDTAAAADPAPAVAANSPDSPDSPAAPVVSGFVGRVLGWFSGTGGIVAGEGVPVVGLSPVPVPVSDNDVASASQATDTDSTRSDGARVVRGIPAWPQSTAVPTAPASSELVPATAVDSPPEQLASARAAEPVAPFDLSAIEQGGFAAILGAMHGMVERCADGNRIREDALKEFRAAYPMLDLDRRDAESSQGGASRQRVDDTFARNAESLKGKPGLNCDYVRLQTIAWTDLAGDLRRMSPESATQYKPGLITEIQRGAGLGGF